MELLAPIDSIGLDQQLKFTPHGIIAKKNLSLCNGHGKGSGCGKNSHYILILTYIQ